MRNTSAALFFGISLTLTSACGGISHGGGSDDTGGYDDTDTYTPSTTTDVNDYDGDGRADGVEDPIVVIPAGDVDESSVPLLCAHQSIFISTSDTCFDGWGTGVEEGWVGCVVDADYATFNGERYQCAPLTDNGDEYRGNFRNSEQSYCADPDDPDFDSFACWADLTGNARVDDFVTRNDDGTYAIAVVISQNVAYPGSGDGTGEE